MSDSKCVCFMKPINECNDDNLISLSNPLLCIQCLLEIFSVLECNTNDIYNKNLFKFLEEGNYDNRGKCLIAFDVNFASVCDANITGNNYNRVVFKRGQVIFPFSKYAENALLEIEEQLKHPTLTSASNVCDLNETELSTDDNYHVIDTCSTIADITHYLYDEEKLLSSCVESLSEFLISTLQESNVKNVLNVDDDIEPPFFNYQFKKYNLSNSLKTFANRLLSFNNKSIARVHNWKMDSEHSFNTIDADLATNEMKYNYFKLFLTNLFIPFVKPKPVIFHTFQTRKEQYENNLKTKMNLFHSAMNEKRQLHATAFLAPLLNQYDEFSQRRYSIFSHTLSGRILSLLSFIDIPICTVTVDANDENSLLKYFTTFTKLNNKTPFKNDEKSILCLLQTPVLRTCLYDALKYFATKTFTTAKTINSKVTTVINPNVNEGERKQSLQTTTIPKVLATNDSTPMDHKNNSILSKVINDDTTTSETNDHDTKRKHIDPETQLHDYDSFKTPVATIVEGKKRKLNRDETNINIIEPEHETSLQNEVEVLNISQDSVIIDENSA